SVWRKHRKAVKSIIVGDSLEAGSIKVDGVQVKVPALRIMHIRGEDYSFTIRKEIRGEVGLTVARYLPLLGTVSFHHPNLERCRSYQILPQQCFVVGNVLLGLWVVGSIDYPLTVVGPERTSVIASLVCESLYVFSIEIHRVNVEVAVSH